jgi:hypothetical protein
MESTVVVVVFNFIRRYGGMGGRLLIIKDITTFENDVFILT